MKTRGGRLAAHLVIAALLALGASPAGAFKTFNNLGPWGVVHIGGTIHQFISSAGLSSFGISEESFSMIDDGNTGQDNVTHYNFTDAPFHHFDDCTIRQSMAYIRAQREQALHYAANAPDDPAARRNALEAFGELLHTAQDFYSHMNYVELALQANPALRPGDIPIVDWNHRPAGLRSGFFFWKNHAVNEIFYSRDACIQGLTELGVTGNFVADAVFATRRRTFEDVLAYATDNSIQVLHADLNKDGPREPEGSVVVPATGLTLHAYAFDLAVRETARQWRQFEEAIRREYPRNAAAIIRALKGGAEAYEPRRVSVLVKDRESGEAIAGARITLGEVSAATNAEGRAICRSPAGRFSLGVTARDYDPSEPTEFEVPEGADPPERTVTLVPQRTEIRLLVTDALTGEPIRGAEVTFHNEERARGIDLTVTTGGDGRAVLRPLRGRWTVISTARFYFRDEQDIDIGPSSRSLEISLRPQPVPVTILVVASEGGRPLRGATVTLGDEARTTDASGEAFFPLTPGAYTATATAAGRRSGSVSFTATVGGGQRSATIQLPAAEADVTIRVVSGEGANRRNVEGASVTAGAAAGTTDAGGVCRLRLAPGAVSITASHPDKGSGEADVEIPEEGGSFTVVLVPPWGELQVSVLDEPTGRPVAGAAVTFAGQQATTNAAGVATFRSEEEGEFDGGVTHADYLNGSFRASLARGRTARATARLVPARCVDAGDREACASTLGGMCPCQRRGACGMRESCLYQAPGTDSSPAPGPTPHGTPCRNDSDRGKCDVNADKCPCGEYGDCGRARCRRPNPAPSQNPPPDGGAAGTARVCSTNNNRRDCGTSRGENCPCATFRACGMSSCLHPRQGSGVTQHGNPCQNEGDRARCDANANNCPCGNYGDCGMGSCREGAGTIEAPTPHGTPCRSTTDYGRCDVNADNCPCNNYGDCGRGGCRRPAGASGGQGTQTTANPGRIVIASPASGTTTRDGVITVTGTVENRAVRVISLNANGSPRDVAVANGAWSTQVPLIRGQNTLQASSGGVASNAVTVTAEIARSAVWTELTWGGAADIDLHLYLPGGAHCYYSNRSAGGAVLDVDNTTANGPEHITAENAVPGEYRLSVLYFSDRSEPTPPISWRVTVRLNDGASQQTYTGVLTREKQEQTVATWRF